MSRSSAAVASRLWIVRFGLALSRVGGRNSVVPTPRTATPDDVRFFATPAKWRQWLDRNHAKADEIWVGFHKKGSGRPSITWPESVDEALCYGWIDGIRKTIDDESYKIRFTPRRKGSIWSAVNIARVGVLTKERRMMP